MSGTASAKRALASGNANRQIPAKSGDAVLNLRIVRGPLATDQDEAILRKYNQLTFSQIPVEEFRHWVQSGPEGPAWHALLETEDGQIAGHICLIPFRTKWRGHRKIIAKAEYFFVEERYRSVPVQGFEDSFKPPAILLLDQLYRHCQAQGLGPLLVSAAPAIQPLHLLVGCRAVDIPLVECLFILRPWTAAIRTPNLTVRQRAAILVAGCAQISLWIAVGRLMRPSLCVRNVPMSSGRGAGDGERLAFFEDEESMRWRYPEKGYVRFAAEESPEECVIWKRGSAARYARVCQWKVACGRSIKPFLLSVVREALAEKALGVRWAVYEGEEAEGLIGQMKRLGFLCVRRTRRLLLYTKDPEFLKPSSWRIADSLFSFDP